MINYLMRSALSRRRFLDLLLISATIYILFTLYSLTIAPKHLNSELKLFRKLDRGYVTEQETQKGDKKELVTFNSHVTTTSWTKVVRTSTHFDFIKKDPPSQPKNNLLSSSNANEFKLNQQDIVDRFHHNSGKNAPSTNAVYQTIEKIQKQSSIISDSKTNNKTMRKSAESIKKVVKNQVYSYKSYDFITKTPIYLVTSKITNHSVSTNISMYSVSSKRTEYSASTKKPTHLESSTRPMILSKRFSYPNYYKPSNINKSKNASFLPSVSNYNEKGFKTDDFALKKFLQKSLKSIRLASSSVGRNNNTLIQKTSEASGKPLVVIDPEKDYKIFWGSIVSISYELNRDYFTQNRDDSNVLTDILPKRPVHLVLSKQQRLPLSPNR